MKDNISANIHSTLINIRSSTVAVFNTGILHTFNKELIINKVAQSCSSNKNYALKVREG